MYPSLENLIVAVGDLGNGLMITPVIGIFVPEQLNSTGAVPEQAMKMMRWRLPIACNRTWWDTQGWQGAGEKITDLRGMQD